MCSEKSDRILVRDSTHNESMNPCLLLLSGRFSRALPQTMAASHLRAHPGHLWLSCAVSLGDSTTSNSLGLSSPGVRSPRVPSSPLPRQPNHTWPFSGASVSVQEHAKALLYDADSRLFCMVRIPLPSNSGLSPI
jgi:hypothetical protein